MRTERSAASSLRPSSLAVILLLGLAVVAVRAAAQGPGRGGGRGPGGPGGGLGVAILMALNTDGQDGLSAAEIAAAPTVLAALDKNKDGRISADELPAMPGRGGPGGGRDGGGGRGGPQGRGGPGEEPAGAGASADELTATLMAFDANKDGKLTRAEVPERLQGLFDRADANKDGVLTEAELKQAAAAQAPVPGVGDGREGRGGRGGPGGRGPGGDPLVSALDTDGDGSLSIAETKNAPNVLRRFDRNGDGVVTIDEVYGGFGRGGGRG